MPDETNTSETPKKNTADKVLLAMGLLTTAGPTVVAMISNYKMIIETGSLKDVDVEEGKRLLEGTKWPDWDTI